MSQNEIKKININKLKPWQITGLTDSRGDFEFSIDTLKNEIKLKFYIKLNQEDKDLLNSIKD